MYTWTSSSVSQTTTLLLVSQNIALLYTHQTLHKQRRPSSNLAYNLWQ
jgi:hypothetical protein